MPLRSINLLFTTLGLFRPTLHYISLCEITFHSFHSDKFLVPFCFHLSRLLKLAGWTSQIETSTEAKLVQLEHIYRSAIRQSEEWSIPALSCLSVSQMLQLKSSYPPNSRRPLHEKETAEMPQMMLSCEYIAISWSDRMSNRRHVASSDPVANARPFGKYCNNKQQRDYRAGRSDPRPATESSRTCPSPQGSSSAFLKSLAVALRWKVLKNVKGMHQWRAYQRCEELQ